MIRTSKSVFAFLFLAATIAAQSASALPLPKPGQLAVTDSRFFAPIETAAGVDFTAIVALSNCSGSLVRFEKSLGTDQAMILTNGHCLGEAEFLKPGEVRLDVPSARTFRLLSADGKKTLGTLTADRILYATMTNTDMTLYRLKETFEKIEKDFDTRALTLSSKHPEATRSIAVVSGYWRKIYSCSIERFVYELHEDAWIFKDSIRYSKPGCETIGGTSGSPIIDTVTKEVVGVNNTGNDDGARCTMDNPCEIDSDGNVIVEKGTSYGQQTFWIYSCLSEKGTLDLNRQGCSLPKPATSE